MYIDKRFDERFNALVESIGIKEALNKYTSICNDYDSCINNYTFAIVCLYNAVRHEWDSCLDYYYYPNCVRVMCSHISIKGDNYNPVYHFSELYKKYEKSIASNDVNPVQSDYILDKIEAYLRFDQLRKSKHKKIKTAAKKAKKLDAKKQKL